MADASTSLDLPRELLAQLPTTIHPVHYAWADTRLFVKRDDLTGVGLTGNKVRKLEYLIADAKQQGCDSLITCGGLQSNHARATAIAAAMTGMQAVLVLGGEPPAELDGNLLLDHIVGADVRIVRVNVPGERTAAMLAAADELRARGRKPYVMPSGGSNEVGALGYMRAAWEIHQQLTADQNIGCVIVPVGSGGTFAGLWLGARLAELRPRVVGAIIEGTIADWRNFLADYINRTAVRWSLDIRAKPQELELVDGAGRGYAQNTPEEIQFIVSFARATGLLLDPVYTGKALYAVDRELRAARFDPSGNVLFIHTGGVFGIFPKRHEFTRAIN
ncbi:MAG TPA: pyridoxal-phosphate dependent enzyme, partial [Phycisphaerae bacterium]